jgi:hypothetical protein
MSNKIAQIIQSLDVNSEIYRSVQGKTNEHSRNILDVMRSIMRVIPQEIFEPYVDMYLHVIEDVCSCAPEDINNSWYYFASSLHQIECDHPNEPYIIEAKYIFNGMDHQ